MQYSSVYCINTMYLQMYVYCCDNVEASLQGNIYHTGRLTVIISKIGLLNLSFKFLSIVLEVFF